MKKVLQNPLKSKNKYQLKGFTLVEIIVSLAIFSLLVIILFSVFNQAVQSWAISEGLVDSQQNARIASDWMTMELHEAVSYYDNNTSVSIPSSTSSTSINNLVFSKPTSETSFTTFTLQTINYIVQNGNLIRNVIVGGSSTSFVIAANIQSFTVSHLLNDTTQPFNNPDNLYDPKMFTVSVFSQTTTSYGRSSTNSNKVMNYTLTSKVRLRNNP